MNLSTDKRLLLSAGLCGVLAVYFAEASDHSVDATQIVSAQEQPLDVPAQGAFPRPAPASGLDETPPSSEVLAEPGVESHLPPAQPAEIVCTFRCASCRRAPTLTYHEGDQLPTHANCIQCGRSMPRTGPTLSDAERSRLPQAAAPVRVRSSRRVYRKNC